MTTPSSTSQSSCFDPRGRRIGSPGSRMAGVPFWEDGRLLGDRLAGFLGVVAVVETDADELARVRDGRMQPGRAPRYGHPFRDGSDRVLAGGAAFEELTCRVRHEGGGDGLRPGHASLGERGGQARLKVGDPGTLKGAEFRRLTVL